jgi:hypothetical protein
MTTFTSEDRITSSQYFTDPGILSDPNPKIWSDVDKSWWGDKDPYPHQLNLKNIHQLEIVFFFPLTEQIPLGLDYTGCEKPKITVSLDNGTTSFYLAPTWGTTNIAPTLSVQPQNSVGQLNIGGIEIGLEKEPKWHQKVLYKLLGFNWKDR